MHDRDPTAAAPGDSQGSRLEQLVFQALERHAQGGSSALEAFVAEHPEDEPALRSELARLASVGLLDDPALPRAFPERLGDFRLIERLGEGGMGVVFAAEQVSLSRPVALKLVRPEQLWFAGARERFRREVEAAARLQHPGIVPIYAVGEQDGLPFFAMERLDGCTLADVLRELGGRDPSTLTGADLARAVEAAAPQRAGSEAAARGALYEGSWSDACLRLAQDVALALEHAHSRGVLHRDVKPSNIALTRSGRALLFDFGLALSGDEPTRLTRSGSQAGSLPYMSPEQLEGRRDLDGRTDVWSLGVTLYELLTLRQPFEAPSTELTRANVLAGDIARPRLHNRRLAGDVETVVLAALERERARRYATAGDLARDLGHLLARAPVEARRVGLALRVLRWSQRHPKVSAGVLAAVPIALLALGALAWLQTDRGRTEQALREDAEDSAALAEQRAREAADSSRLAAERERVAVDAMQKVLRLSDFKRLDDLAGQVDGLYPPGPAAVPRIEAWLSAARELVARRPLHAAALDELRRPTAPSSDESAWQSGVLEQVLAGLERLESEGDGSIAKVDELLAFSSGLQRRSVDGVEAAALWEAAAASIRDECPVYEGLDLRPQLGLLPLGRDPDSGLWEFAHLQSGSLPERGEDGRLVCAEDACIVLVLLPLGEFLMGAQSADPLGDNYDSGATPDESPIVAVALDPFFIAKHELTQAQWRRVMGGNPSFYRPGIDGRGIDYSERHPVENVTWTDCDRALRRMGLVLPTEAQHEYATRAGSELPWLDGDDVRALDGCANIADREFHYESGLLEWKVEEWLLDGYNAHAPVGSYRANAFGLHDVHGNVWEFCLDHFWSLDAPSLPGTGQRTFGDPVHKVQRGGSFTGNGALQRNSVRIAVMPHYISTDLGARAARSIAP
jgi:serine/threonine protein kinase/formylglycine-generating enzyme required for sulfatase activity